MRAHKLTIFVAALLSALTLGLLYVLWPVLRSAPELIFPLMITTLLGGAFVIAVLAKRRNTRS